jgi:hypothetical protein
MSSLQDLHRQPKWVQHRIQKLEADLAKVEQDLYEVRTGTTNIQYGPPSPFEEDRKYLPSDETIYFTLDNGSISCRIHDGRLYVTSTGYNQIVIEPVTSNAFNVVLLKRK